MALSNKLRGNGRVTTVFFGDGASCEGAFFETLNMATLWKVPLVFVCENNGYAISVPTSMAIPIADIAQRAQGFGLPGVTVDGNDPALVYQAMRQAIAHARDGKGPTLLECKTVRWERHSAISAGKYDNPESAEAWKRADPIPRLEAELRRRGVSDDQLLQCKQRAQARNDQAMQFATQSAAPPKDSVEEFVFA
jgi:TPP-dependent pyruvate/acetoin dehydrogenase alpha subunit